MHNNGTRPTSIEAELQLFRGLPGTIDEFFRRLWDEHRLRYVGPEKLDLCDELSARLAIAAMVNHRLILIAFPDSQIHRAAAIFATVLLRFWWDTRQQNTPKRVIYLGSHIGIRDQLGAVKVANLSIDLGSIFEETHLSRHEVVGTYEFGSSRMPRVVTVYSPADTRAVFASYPPDLIAVDIGARAEALWFNDAIDYAKTHGVPLVAWGQNPLSRAFREFSFTGEVFTWPPQRRAEVLDDPTVLLGTRVRPVTPIIPIGTDAERYSDLLQEAIKVLAGNKAQGRLDEHALAAHWQYVRILEALQVPVEIYEAEALRYWGLRSIARVQQTCQRFQESCGQSALTLASDLQIASSLLDEALATARASTPPLWRILATICVEGVKEGSFRHITFTSRARRDLFAYSLLARFNISDDDLRSMNIGLSVPDELWTDLNRQNGPHLISTTIGIPSPSVAPKILPALLFDTLEFVVYRHQLPALERRLSEYGQKMSAAAITATGNTDASQIRQNDRNVFDRLAPVTVDLGKGRIQQIVDMPKWIEVSAETEAVGLFDDLGREDIIESSEDAFARATPQDEESSPAEFCCDTALQVEFEDGSRVLFPPDAQANVIVRKEGRQIAEERFVRALRLGDQIVFIQGQQRQNLYDLLVHRVHSHPAFQIHLVLINRWQDDFISAFGRSARIRTFQQLLNEMQDRGSSLVSPLTLRNWLGRSTLCPDDEKDLLRAGEIFNLSFITQHYKRIAKAAGRIRGLHRGLANRLNHWLEKGAVIVRESDVIDSELGLKFSDFASSFVILRVRDLREVNGPFLRSGLGKLERM